MSKALIAAITNSDSSATGDTRGTLGFVDRETLPPENEKPYIIVFSVDHVPGARQSNFDFLEKSDIPIRNIRGQEHLFQIDKHGFEVQQWKFDPAWVVDEHSVQNLYCREAEKYLQRVLEAKEVLVFDWLVRKNTPVLQDRRFRKQLRPAKNVHIDQSSRSAVNRVKYHMGDRADSLLRKRFQIVNLWRPLFSPIEDWPLAVGDYRTISQESILNADTVGRGRYKGESSYMMYDAAQEYWYLKDQTVDEIWVMKQWDSDQTIAQYCPHTAFHDPRAPQDARPRESIELRTLVFYG